MEHKKLPSNEIEFILEECNQFLNDWERDFLNNIKNRKPETLSIKQRDTYQRIRDKTSERYSESEDNSFGNEFRWDQ